MGSPPFSSGLGASDGAMQSLSAPGGTFPGDQGGGSGGYPGMPPSHSPHSGLDRSPSSQFSPLYSPNSNNLPISSDNSEHHFLANDKPRDKGGGGHEVTRSTSADSVLTTSRHYMISQDSSSINFDELKDFKICNELK